jgi:hypothetical protein
MPLALMLLHTGLLARVDVVHMALRRGDVAPILRRQALAAAVRCAIARLEQRLAASTAPSAAFCIWVRKHLRAGEIDGDGDETDAHCALQRPHHGEFAAAALISLALLAKIVLK